MLDRDNLVGLRMRKTDLVGFLEGLLHHDAVEREKWKYEDKKQHLRRNLSTISQPDTPLQVAPLLLL
jgi:hypothetical protein